MFSQMFSVKTFHFFIFFIVGIVASSDMSLDSLDSRVLAVIGSL